ncbi:MAG TPA: branched-chain amino acid ABC transporter permease [Bacillota bacterium]
MLQYLANGLVVGAVVALAAIGLSLVYSVLRLINFAHGDTVTVGAYIALFVNTAWGLAPWHAVPFAFIVGAAVSLLLEALVWRKMRALRAGAVSRIVASIGLALVLRNLIVFAFGAEPQAYRAPVQMAFAVPGLPNVRITPDQGWILVAAVAAVAGVHALLRYSSIGKAMRALADDADLAAVSGVPVQRVIVYTWLIGGGLAAAAGAMYGMTRPLHPELGWFMLLPMFAAIILGGTTNAYGAILGGFLIGIVQEVSVVLIPSEYKLAVAFAVMILALLCLPRGLLGQEVLR